MTGMTIPAGSRYRSTARSCNSTSGNGLASSNGNWTTLANDVDVRANCTVQMGYVPATFYLPASAPAPAGYLTAEVNRPLIRNACGPGCDMRRYQILDANYPKGSPQLADAKTNFANWFQYHRNRILSMVGSSSHAMAGVENMRVGYFTINNRQNVTMFDVATQRADLFAQIYRLKPAGGTPNRQAVAFLGEQFRRTDSGAPVIRACQKNGGMLFTDGYTNANNVASGYGNADAAGGTTSRARRLPTDTPIPLPISPRPTMPARSRPCVPAPASRLVWCPCRSSARIWIPPRRTGSGWIARPTCT